jgi:hypothetical protein
MLECWNDFENLQMNGVVEGRKSSSPCGVGGSPCGWRVALQLAGGGELRTRRRIFGKHAGMLECWNDFETL